MPTTYAGPTEGAPDVRPDLLPAPHRPRRQGPHLVFGLLLLGVAGIWALGTSRLIRGEHLTLLGPGVLIAVGVIGLAASLAGARQPCSAPQPFQPFQPDDETYEHTQEIR